MIDGVEKLAKEITRDLYNHKINLSFDEKCERIREFLRMTKKFENIRGVKCSKILFESTLLPRYISLKPQRISKMFRWLCDNWKKYNKDFPEIPDFEEARKQTDDNYAPDTFDKEYVCKEYPFEALSEAFSEIKINLPEKHFGEIKKHSQVVLYRRMASAGMVFRVDKMKWVPREGLELGCEIIDPRPVVEKMRKREKSNLK